MRIEELANKTDAEIKAILKEILAGNIDFDWNHFEIVAGKNNIEILFEKFDKKYGLDDTDGRDNYIALRDGNLIIYLNDYYDIIDDEEIYENDNIRYDKFYYTYYIVLRKKEEILDALDVIYNQMLEVARLSENKERDIWDFFEN